MKELICIKTYPNRADAELARTLLEENGIKAMVSGDDAGGAYPGLLWGTGGARLLVRKKDKEKALSLLEK
ncbi:DUF2007 domain-containing protein [Patescibacteria group bacterium]|nr:DUF2007 domain-containing protein [Patescibacteria group bacterium]